MGLKIYCVSGQEIRAVLMRSLMYVQDVGQHEANEAADYKVRLQMLKKNVEMTLLIDNLLCGNG